MSAEEPVRVPISWHAEDSVHEFPVADIAIDEAFSGLAVFDMSRPTGFIRPNRLTYLRLLGVRDHLLVRPDFSYAEEGTQKAVTVDVTLAGYNGDLIVRAVNFLLFEPQSPLYLNIDCSFGAEFLRRFRSFSFDLASQVLELIPAHDGECDRLPRLDPLGDSP